MKKTGGHLAGRTAMALLLAIVSASPAFAQSAPATPARASIQAYLPELQRLQQASDWVGLERLARAALGTLELAAGPDSTDVGAAASFLGTSLLRQGRYPEAEPQYRRAMDIDEKAYGPEQPDSVASLNNLALLLKMQGRYADAEPMYRSALAIREKTLGASHAETAISLNNLAELLKAEGRYREAEPMYRRALAIREGLYGPEHPESATFMTNLAALLTLDGRYAEAEPLSRHALKIRETALGPDNWLTAISAYTLADLLRYQGGYAEAEQLYRRALAIDERARGPDHPDTATCLSDLGLLLEAEGRYAEAVPFAERALAIRDKALGPEHPVTAGSANNLGVLLALQGRYADAEVLFRRALAIDEKSLGAGHRDTAAILDQLANLLAVQGRYAEGEPLSRRALAIREQALGAEHIDTAASLNDLARLLQAQGRYGEAEPLLRRALAIDEKAAGPEHPTTATVLENLAFNDESAAKFGDATVNYRRACAIRWSSGRGRDLSGDGALAARMTTNYCSVHYSLALWNWSAQGGGTAPGDHPDALRTEAFAVTQRATQSAAGAALARSAALATAESATVGAQARAYEAALLERDTLDRQLAKAVGDPSQSRLENSQLLAKAHDDVALRIDRLASELKSKVPRYWDYRSPEPVSVASLQSAAGDDARLLHDNEALIVWSVAARNTKGLVFAVSKQRMGWAQLGFTAAELQARVTQLRGQIDPEGYGLRGIAVAPGAQRSAATQPETFDRQASYELYQALLGNSAIQEVIKDKAVLLFVPSGALTSLPPGLLVTAQPPQSAAPDASAAEFRATAWLLRSKAVSLLPAVSSLRTLRQIAPSAHVDASDPLLAFADPEFHHAAGAAPASAASGSARGVSTYFRDGQALGEALEGLPSLPGTRIEGEALQRALNGRPGSVLTGLDASKAQLMARNGDGRLARVRVLEFATHGLVAGDTSDLAEPALALAVGVKPEDELLLASEAATLRLNADWVLLSACNTASPDAPQAQGLSGLSRAFFYAGAKSLLVSHWRVRDDVAPVLIPAMLLAERKNPHLGRAQALRQASLAILDDAHLQAASPAAWAPFTLIGEAGP
jgi:tetratricopeptide (TPR) repeat protein/CHAT domain-containing protein